MTPEFLSPTTKEVSETSLASGVTQKVFAGGAWIFAGQLIPLGLSFLATPIVIRLLGTELFGVYTLMNVILAYAPLADFGMSLSSTAFAARAHAKTDRIEEAKVIHSAMVIALCPAVAIATSLIFGARFLVTDVLRLPDSLTTTAVYSIYIISIAFVARVLAGIVNSSQLARLRMDLNSAINATASVGQILMVPIVVYLGGGVIGAVLTIMLFALGAAIAHFIASARLLPQLLEWRPDRSTIKSLVNAGLLLFVCSAASLILANVEKFALTRYISVSALSYYGVAFTLVAMLTLFSSSLSQAMLPAVSQLHSTKSSQDLNVLFGRAILYSLAIYAPAACLLLVIARPFLSLWAGEDFGRESTPILHILTPGIFFVLIATMASTVLVAVRKANKMAILYWLEVPVYLALVVFATSRFGVRGGAAAWSLRAVCEGIALWFLMKGAVGAKERSVEIRFWKLAVSSVILVALPILGDAIFIPAVVLYPFTFVALLIFGVYFWLHILTAYERSGFQNLITVRLRRQ